ncbi:MAG: hypothetical protein FJ194_16190 [Gammaproteobacteria bacterium]|nr:hypothetical protein [Gammaproteobacteria bacterium]
MAAIAVANEPATASATPGVSDPARSRIDYMLHCQGCHGPDGSGTRDGVVPKLEDQLAKFLTVPGGREFLVQVPGSANAALPADRLAAVLNWMVLTFDSSNVPADFSAYSADEVAKFRSTPLSDVSKVRAELIKMIEASNTGSR